MGTRAARLSSHGTPLRVEDVDLPAPGPDEVRIDLAWAGVNPVDRYVAAGRVAPDGPLPRTLGGEGSGYCEGETVIVTGEGLGAGRDGVFAEAAVVPRSAVVPVPPGVDLREAAAMGIAGLTAWNVARLGRIAGDDRVLVLGAGGGVGLPLVSLAASSGATVWGQTGSPGKVAAVRDHGAAEVIVADAEGLADAAGPLAPTVVVDALGDGYTPAALSVLRPGGRLVVFGTSAGAEVRLDLQQVYRNGLEILGYGGLRLSQDDRVAGLAGALAALADGRMRIHIGSAFPLDAVNDALAAVGDRSVTGKVILDLRLATRR